MRKGIGGSRASRARLDPYQRETEHALILPEGSASLVQELFRISREFPEALVHCRLRHRGRR